MKKKKNLPKLAGVMNLLLPEATHWENAHHDDTHANAWCHKCAPIGFTWNEKLAYPVAELSSMNISKYWLLCEPAGLYPQLLDS